jgi:hypothetical protein
MHLYPCASSYTDEQIADVGPPQTRAHVLRLCARACARTCAIGRPRIRADACDCLLSAWTACGSASRRSSRHRRSTRTSARGTPRVSPRCPRYAPPFRPGGVPPLRHVLGGLSVRRGPLCLAGPHRALARLCADVWARACDGVHGCRYSCVYDRRLTCMYVYMCVCIIHIHLCTCVLV